jgi:hypothetical protein
MSPVWWQRSHPSKGSFASRASLVLKIGVLHIGELQPVIDAVAGVSHKFCKGGLAELEHFLRRASYPSRREAYHGAERLERRADRVIVRPVD